MSPRKTKVHLGETDWNSVRKLSFLLQEYFRAQKWPLMMIDGDVQTGCGGTHELNLTDLAKYMVARKEDWSK